jgi:predicted DCC family thiol-disulfide oxidoreductase YuxK
MSDPHPVILFDGVCNLCNASVQFIINRDPKAKFKFASLQSEAGQQLLKQFNLAPDKLYSVIVVYQNKAHDRSRAALEIARRLSGLWPLFYGFIIVPPIIRNFIYDWISRNRYRWFGVRQECMMPTPDMKARFL